MIECIFTLDYEVYGNGDGSLQELVYAPAAKLKSLFDEHQAKFVVFAEAVELERIERYQTDPYIGEIGQQLREFHTQGFEIGLHVHPWWYNARRQDGTWVLDYDEYTMAALSRERIGQMIDESISYLRRTLQRPDFQPLSFRAGHLLFRPACTLAAALAERGICIDSSVYPGGVWRQYQLDYRQALRNGPYWRFTADASVPDAGGELLEVPIHTRMVPVWTMFTSKRVALERRNSSASQTGKKLLHRLTDFARFRRPLKLDFCHMTIDEFSESMDRIQHDDRRDPATFRPIVAIGHSKELVDFEAVGSFLSSLQKRRIRVSTFADIYDRLSVPSTAQ